MCPTHFLTHKEVLGIERNYAVLVLSCLSRFKQTCSPGELCDESFLAFRARLAQRMNAVDRAISLGVTWSGSEA